MWNHGVSLNVESYSRIEVDQPKKIVLIPLTSLMSYLVIIMSRPQVLCVPLGLTASVKNVGRHLQDEGDSLTPT